MNVQQSWQEPDPEHVSLALAGHDVPWVVDARQSAFERFKAHGFPSRREEEWKYTDVSVLSRRASLLPDNIPPDAPSEAALYAWMLSQQNVHLMVFINGHYSPELSCPGNLGPGVRLESFADMLDDAAELPQALFDQQHEHTVFDALNTAFSTDGAVLRLAPGARLEMPVYLLFIASGYGVSIYPRNIVVAGAGAQATVVEHYLGMVDAHNFTDSTTQLELGAGAMIEHCKLLQEGSAAYHLAGIHADLAADSRFISHSFALGSRLARNDITVRLSEPGGHCTLNGLYLLNGRQHADHHTRIDHLAPSCVSREYYRGVLDGESRGVFSGKVTVHPGAVKTDAHQSNHNLLLSREAEVDTKPQLEIFADDVRCTHGATVGQLDDDSLFYLRSRGLDAETARSMLIYGFANEIIERVPVPELRNRIADLVLDRLSQGDSIKELL
ncbi:MAG TPA: Fe-S cluster assembly protein SufD [Novimethylophilus sp.]|uniref:Fe-S cluster assembly protein SufD n=1 Tax=Novimethylophilus sp. TaxID=2137426 RepID=UPI002F410DB7